MQQSIGKSISQIPWWAYLLLIFLPFWIGCIMAIAIITYWKNINLNSGGNEYSVKRQYWSAFVTGFVCGCFCQYGFQETLEVLVFFPDLTIKATVVTGVLVAIFNPMIYDLTRSYAKRKEIWGLYNFLTVKHEPDEEIEYLDNTLMVNSEDVTEQ
jgi:hypothetical protein